MLTQERKASLPSGEKMVDLSVYTKEIGERYQSLSASDKAELTRRYDEIRAAYPAKLAAWKETLTPEIIHEENLVRMRRRKLGLYNRKINKTMLRLDGEPRRPMGPFVRSVAAPLVPTTTVVRNARMGSFADGCALGGVGSDKS